MKEELGHAVKKGSRAADGSRARARAGSEAEAVAGDGSRAEGQAQVVGGRIEGVRVKALRVIPDERGRLMEMLRRDDEIFRQFGQVYMTTAYPGVVKGWHYHRRQWDHFVCVRGMIKLVLYDDREGSPTRGAVDEFFIGEHNPLLVQIPPFVFHGFKCISEHEAIVINTPTEPYDREEPDEYRIPAHGGGVPYDWGRADG